MKVKILHLIPEMSTGGAETLLLDAFPLMLKQNEFEHILCTFYATGILGDVVKACGVSVKTMNAKHTFLSNVISSVKLALQLKKREIKIVHVHLMLSHVLILRLIAPKVKYICTLHQNKKYNMFVLKQYTKIITCGNTLFSNMEKHVDNSKLIKILNAIDFKRVVSNVPRIEARSKLGLNETDIMILTVGRLVPQKNHRLLFEAFSKALVENSSLMLFVAGDGPLRSIFDKNKNSRVRLLGNCSNVAELYKAADMYINTSIMEGLALTLIEAMANRLPVIASDVDGNRDMRVSDNMVLFNNTEQGCIKEIIQMAGSKKYRESVAKKGYEFAIKSYSIERYCGEVHSLYIQETEKIKQ